MVFVRVIPAGFDGVWRLFIGLLQVFAAFLVIATVFSFFGLRRGRWQQGAR